MDDFEPTPSLAEKRRRYFAARDKKLADTKGFRKLAVDSGPQGPQFIMMLLCILGIALVTFQIFGPTLYQEDSEDVTEIFPGDEPDQAEEPGVRLDPQPLRSYLIRLEMALFEPSSADSFESIVGDLVLELDRFSEHLKSSEETRQETLATELDAMALLVRDEGFNLEGLTDIQNQWRQARNRSFQSASWFKTANASNTDSRATYAVYRDISDRLLRHVGSGLSEAEDVIEENSDIGALESDQPARRELLDNWKVTAQEWRAEVEALQRAFPERPAPSAPNNLLDAIHRLETAIREGQGRLPADRLPTADDLVSLEDALARAQVAAETFDALP